MEKRPWSTKQRTSMLEKYRQGFTSTSKKDARQTLENVVPQACMLEPNAFKGQTCCAMHHLTEVVVSKRLQVGRRRQYAVVVCRFPVVSPPLPLGVLGVPQVFLHHFLKRQMLFETLHTRTSTACDILKANKPHAANVRRTQEGLICRRSAACRAADSLSSVLQTSATVASPKF